jgi:hypothetical protein
VNSIPKRSFTVLITAILAWVAFFLAFAGASTLITSIDQRFSTFLSAALLTILSAYIVYGFSRLALERSIYLLTGTLAIGLVYLAATPMVKQDQQINTIGDISGQSLYLSTVPHSSLPGSESILMPVRNGLFRAHTGFLKNAASQSEFLIILLAMAQLAMAAGIGLWIAEGIDDITHLIPVALVATIADIWSVSAGTTAKIVVSSSINFFLLRFPVLGNNSIPFLIGLTDFLFFAIFFQAAVRYKLGALKNAILLILSFFIAIITALYSNTGLPVLPFMAVLFIAGNFSRLELKKEELKQVLLFVIVILLVFALVTYKLS